MNEMHKIKITSVNKGSEEYLSQLDNPTDIENLTFNDVQIDNEYNDQCKEENKDSEHNSMTEDVKTLPTAHDKAFNKDTIILSQELYENSNIANHVVSNNNHFYEMSTFSRHKDTWSYIEEFDLFLKEYKDNYNNYSPSTTMGSPIPTASGTQQFMYDINNDSKYEELLSSPSLCENSENYLPRRNSSDNDMTIENNLYTKDSCNSGDIESPVASTSEIIQKNKCLNTEIVLNDDDEKKNYTYEFLDDFNLAVKRDIATVEEKDNIVSVSSNSDCSTNKVSSFSKMEIDFRDEFAADTDCEGYHSSDFEFIDETEAGLEGIINKSYSDIKYYNFTDDTFEATEDHKVNFDEAGPSWLRYDRTVTNSPRFNSSMDDSSVEELNNNHVIPEGEQLYELFSEPWTVFNYEAENKAFYSNKAMHFDVDNIGFNVGILQERHKENEVDDDVKQEAMENARKILMIYPVENAKRRRRRF